MAGGYPRIPSFLVQYKWMNGLDVRRDGLSLGCATSRDPVFHLRFDPFRLGLLGSETGFDDSSLFPDAMRRRNQYHC